MKIAITCTTMMLALSALSACEQDYGPFESAEHQLSRMKREEDEKWNEPCHDESKLVATNAGSPSEFKCTNKRQRMRVQTASSPSVNNFGAVVFCECDHNNIDAGTDK